MLMRLYTINGRIKPKENKIPLSKLREMYQEGHITWRELQAQAVEWSTDASGRKFYYICPDCHAPMRHCPDPACVGVGHHLLDEDWEECNEDIPYNTALMYYESLEFGSNWSKSWCVNMTTMEKIKKELQEAVAAVLAKYDSDDHGGCEMHGEIRGIIQHKDAPETATGWNFPLGNGLPKGWL